MRSKLLKIIFLFVFCFVFTPIAFGQTINIEHPAQVCSHSGYTGGNQPANTQSFTTASTANQIASLIGGTVTQIGLDNTFFSWTDCNGNMVPDYKITVGNYSGNAGLVALLFQQYPYSQAMAMLNNEISCANGTGGANCNTTETKNGSSSSGSGSNTNTSTSGNTGTKTTVNTQNSTTGSYVNNLLNIIENTTKRYKDMISQIDAQASANQKSGQTNNTSDATNPSIIVTADVLNVRSLPIISSSIVRKVSMGDKLSASCYVYGDTVEGSSKWWRLTDNGHVWAGGTQSNGVSVPVCSVTSTNPNVFPPNSGSTVTGTKTSNFSYTFTKVDANTWKVTLDNAALGTTADFFYVPANYSITAASAGDLNLQNQSRFNAFYSLPGNIDGNKFYAEMFGAFNRAFYDWANKAK